VGIVDGFLRRLIVTADDFGAAREVNEAVELAHTRGILTAASLMMSGAAVDDAVARAQRLPALRVGLHLVLVDGAPLLPRHAVRDLVDADGRFPADLARAGRNIFFRPSARRQLRAEIAAQFDAFHATGLALDHVNAHHHFHLHPTVAALVLEIGATRGVRGLRVPREPADVVARADPSQRPQSDWRAGLCAALLARRTRQRGLMTPANVFGLAWSGMMTQSRLENLLRRLPGGISEIYTHPATGDGFAGASGGHAQELAALMAPSVVKLLRGSDIATGGYSDFIAA
jgi:hopanoid biosynthesis associated protein HpnK